MLETINHIVHCYFQKGRNVKLEEELASKKIDTIFVDELVVLGETNKSLFSFLKWDWPKSL